MTTLPPTRDLPPERQTRIRAELERAVTRRRSRLTVPILAATAAVAAVVVGVVVMRPGPSEPVPAIYITTSPTAAAPSDEELARKCAQRAGEDQPVQLYQRVEDEAGAWVLLYSERSVVTCDVDDPGLHASLSLVGRGYTRWLPGHFSVDHIGFRVGGESGVAQPEVKGQHGYSEVAGRVDATVKRVTFSMYGQTVEAKIVNGTYTARIVHPVTWRVPGDIPTEDVRAYDAAGNLLGQGADLPTSCFYDPASQEVVHGERNQDGSNCKPATPWH